jgi:hypothetical protein
MTRTAAGSSAAGRPPQHLQRKVSLSRPRGGGARSTRAAVASCAARRPSLLPAVLRRAEARASRPFPAPWDDGAAAPLQGRSAGGRRVFSLGYEGPGGKCSGFACWNWMGWSDRGRPTPRQLSRAWRGPRAPGTPPPSLTAFFPLSLAFGFANAG